VLQQCDTTGINKGTPVLKPSPPSNAILLKAYAELKKAGRLLMVGVLFSNCGSVSHFWIERAIAMQKRGF